MENKDLLSKYFDKVVILNLIKDSHKKYNMDKQCEDLFRSSYSYHKAVIFSGNKSILEGFNNANTGQFRKPNEVGCAMEHYRIIKEAYEEGLNNILVMEDDIAFLKNWEYIKNTFEHIPADWNILMMSSYIGIKSEENIDLLKNSEKVNDYWFVPFWPGWCTAMYALNRKGMQYYLNSQDLFFQVADMPLYNALKFQENKKHINTYFSIQPLAIQKDLYYASSIRNQHEILEKKKWNLYEKNIDEKNYYDFLEFEDK